MKNFSVIKKKMAHIFFEVGLALKALNSLLEITGSVLLLIFNPVRIQKVMVYLSESEYWSNPSNRVSRYLVELGTNLSPSAQQFATYYLMSHGGVKLAIVFLLWRKILIAYPMAIAAMASFIAYQVHHFIVNGSVYLLVISFLDLMMIIFTYFEWQGLRRKKREAAAEKITDL